MENEGNEEVLRRRSAELCQKFWLWRLENFPEFATSVGEIGYNDKLTDTSLDGFQRRFNESIHILNEVSLLSQCFEENSLSCTNIDVLRFELTTFVDGFKYHSYLCPVSIVEGPQVTFATLLSSMPQETAKDYEDILSRLRLLSTQVENMIALMREGIRKNITSHAYSIFPVINQFRDMVNQPVIESPLFQTFLNGPVDIPVCDWTILVEKCTSILQLLTYRAFEKFIQFLDEEYIAHTRDEISVQSLPNGKDLYCACLKYHTDTDLTPTEIHTIGLEEVKRIQNRANDLLQEINFQGNYVDLIQQLQRDVFSYNDDEIIEGYSVIYDNILEKLSPLFNCLPSKKCEIKAMRSMVYPGGWYRQGNGNQPGKFWINTDKIKGVSHKAYALALHEMIPGHHLQSSIVLQKTDIPNFRKFRESGNYYTIPGRFPLYTSYMEGWAMYAEYLGEELNMYNDPYHLLGRLFNELFRAARLVIDTGIHGFGWRKGEAVSYMMDVTGMEAKFASSEVDRYITWPGQACSYKIGELKIKEFREMTSSAQGEAFDLKTFHDVILQSGEIPFEHIERNIQLHIRSEKC